MSFVMIDLVALDDEDKDYIMGINTKRELRKWKKELNLIDKFIGEFRKGRYRIIREDKLYDIEG